MNYDPASVENSMKMDLRRLAIGYGIAAAGFASLLAIYSKGAQTTGSTAAAMILAISTPLAVALTTYSQILDLPRNEYEPRHTCLRWTVLILLCATELGCVIGILIMLSDFSCTVAWGFGLSIGASALAGLAYLETMRRSNARSR
jgi:hypothetical protein